MCAKYDKIYNVVIKSLPQLIKYAKIFAKFSKNKICI